METDNKNFDFVTFRHIRERSIGRLFWRLKRYISGYVEPRLHAIGYENFKMSSLMFLSNIDEQGTTNNELARRVCVTKQMTSKMVGMLEAEGYLHIQKNPADSRSGIIMLSNRGKRLYVDLVSVMDELRQKFDGIIGLETMDAIIDNMYTLVNELEKDEQ